MFALRQNLRKIPLLYHNTNNVFNTRKYVTSATRNGGISVPWISKMSSHVNSGQAKSIQRYSASYALVAERLQNNSSSSEYSQRRIPRYLLLLAGAGCALGLGSSMQLLFGEENPSATSSGNESSKEKPSEKTTNNDSPTKRFFDALFEWDVDEMARILDMEDALEWFRNPTHETEAHLLLPPPTEEYLTVVLDIQDLLYGVKKDGKTLYKKRKGLDQFLVHLSMRYEVILWCSGSDAMTDAGHAQQIADKTNTIAALLLYQHGKYTQQGLIKDLTRLNRPLNRIIHVTSNPIHGAMQPDNTLLIPKWDGSGDGSQTLTELMAFLKGLHSQANASMDVRKSLKLFQGKTINQIVKDLDLDITRRNYSRD